MEQAMTPQQAGVSAGAVAKLVEKWRPENHHVYVSDGASRDPSCSICGGEYYEAVHNMERVKCADELELAIQQDGQAETMAIAYPAHRHPALATAPPEQAEEYTKEMIEAMEERSKQPQATSAGAQSRSVQRRVALQKGELVPTFGAASAGALDAEQREKLLALAGDCWDRDWDVNQNKVDEFIGYVNSLLAAHDQKVRAATLEEAANEAKKYGLGHEGDSIAAAIRRLRFPAAAPAASKPETGKRRD